MVAAPMTSPSVNKDAPGGPGQVPPESIIPGARAQIRRFNSDTGRRIAVLDDDPTGSQSVQGVQVVTVLDRQEYLAGLDRPGGTGFILTNTRGLSEPEAVDLNQHVGADLYALEAELAGRVEIVSRSDSCLRGHVAAEVTALVEVALRAGRAIDGILFAPALFGAGRFTVEDIHWAKVDGTAIPVSETEFAKDKTFGYHQSDLKLFLEEHSRGEISVKNVLSISLENIRGGGPDAVAEVLRTARDAQWIVVNAVSDHDLDIVVLGLQKAQVEGKSFLYRTGPSFVRALAGLDPLALLKAEQISLPAGSTGYGLIAVGSHTGATTAQIETLKASGDLAQFELRVELLLDNESRGSHLESLIEEIRAALGSVDVLIYTSRTVAAGDDAAASLDIAREVSTALVEVVAAVRSARPSWVVAKGGITSHDVAARGLGIRRAVVVGQFPPGGVSLFDPLEAPPEVMGLPYVVFPGNVGQPETLADVVSILHAATRCR